VTIGLLMAYFLILRFKDNSYAECKKVYMFAV